jgi:single-strand DNA-binding protein
MNKTIIMGRICKDLELRYSQSNVALLSFNVAVNRKFVKEGEDRQTDFISCKAFGKTAENISKYFSKGKLILIEGRIQTGSYDKDGVKIYTTDVIVEGFDFTGEKKQEQEQGDACEPNPFSSSLTSEEDDDLPF